jgi:DNA primase
LVAKLLGVDFKRARDIVGEEERVKPDDELRRRLKGAVVKTEDDCEVRSVKWEWGIAGLGNAAISHLIKRRRFTELEVERLESHYGVKQGYTGRWMKRILFPYHVERLGLVGWTGRTFLGAPVKYLAFPDRSVKKILFNGDKAAAGGRTLYVLEGPIDALKVDLARFSAGDRAVALAGLNWTANQISALYQLSRKYDRLAVWFDPGAFADAMQLQGRLRACGKPIDLIETPAGYEDAGAMPTKEINRFLKSRLK